MTLYTIGDADPRPLTRLVYIVANCILNNKDLHGAYLKDAYDSHVAVMLLEFENWLYKGYEPDPILTHVMSEDSEFY